MPEMTVVFEVYCGVCKEGLCFHTQVEDNTLTVTCPYCKRKIEEFGEEIKKLKRERREAKKILSIFKDKEKVAVNIKTGKKK